MECGTRSFFVHVNCARSYGVSFSIIHDACNVSHSFASHLCLLFGRLHVHMRLEQHVINLPDRRGGHGHDLRRALIVWPPAQGRPRWAGLCLLEGAGPVAWTVS